MKYKELQTGLIPVNTTYQRLFEETCNEYSFMSIDIFNRAGNGLDLKLTGGWDSLASKLTSGGSFGITAVQSDFASNVTAQSNSNVAIRLIQLDGITPVNSNGQITANGQGGVFMSVNDIQALYFDAGRPSGVGDAEVFGIFKSALEGISAAFETGSITPGNSSAWIDCRAYSTMSFEVQNTGSVTLSGLQGQRRRHLATTMATQIAFSFTGSSNPNPMAIIQQVQNGGVAANSPSGVTAIDINVTDLHGIRFSVTAGQCVIRGVLKG